ncbi:uncharacterized protein [Parasteatoda tepidariorum]|uniref:uncharacterized protein n=1 Tax=Parasteatoda tepidariorum TaxID=114398 RepID=UPI00077F8530|nr:uncharacterized protein LOC107452121 [Parasteatoda tepidariorum]XP_015923923.1 uncharacterized protein LOC107452121 [Parasteatoda tepidariorum]
MLKHVSSSNLSPYKVQFSRDTVSLSSFGSSGIQESSRSSSTSSLHDSRPSKITIKVYTKVLCADMEYKTLCITPQTTSKDVVRMLLSKFKVKHRDPNLFYLTMEVWVRKTGIPIRSVVSLEDDAHPAELQVCHPRGESKFSLKMRRGGLVKVFGGSCLMAGSLYKSLLVSDKTTTSDLIQLVLNCYNSREAIENFSIYEISCNKDYERQLLSNEYPLQIQQLWPTKEQFAFQLRRNVEGFQKQINLKVPWFKSHEKSNRTNVQWIYEKNNLRLQALSENEDAFNTYENCFYI